MFQATYLALLHKTYLFCLNISGVWPFDYDTRSRRFKFNSFYLIGPFILVPYTTADYILSMNVLMDSVSSLFKNIVLKMVSYVFVSSTIVNFLFLYITQFFQWKKIQSLAYRSINLHGNLCRCLSLDERDMYYVPNLIKFTIKSVVFTTTLLIYMIVGMTLVSPDALQFYTIPGFLTPAIINKFYPDIHYGGMLLADFYLLRFNKNLKRILRGVIKDEQKPAVIVDQLDSLAMNYVELIETVNEFNNIVSVHMVVWILLGVFNFLNHLFMEYVFIGVPIRYGHSLNTVISATGVVVLVYQFLEFWFTTSVCASVLRKVDETETILSSVYVQLQNDGPFARSIDLFVSRLNHSNFQISASGLFSLDLPFLYSIVCSSASYLIILIQFELAM